MTLIHFLSAFFLLLPILAGGVNVHERRDSPPVEYTSRGPAPSNHTLKLRLALVQNNVTGLEKRLLEISSPVHPDYGNWMSKDEVDAHVAPSRKTTDVVQAFLASNDLTASNATSAGDVLSLEITVEKASALFAADFQTFQSAESGSTVVRTLAYSMPSALLNHVKYVHPMIVFPAKSRGSVSMDFPSASANVEKRLSNSSCDPTAVTPECLIELYMIPTGPLPQTNVTIGITGLNSSTVHSFRLLTFFQIFLETFRPDLVNNTWTFQSVLNGTIVQRSGAAQDSEPDLDTQMVIGLASGVEALYLSVGPEPTTDALLDFAEFLVSLDTLPSVLTTSFENGNTDSSFPLAQAIDYCNLYMQLGARGTSIIWSSGDSGVGEGCIDGQFSLAWPDSCPYVTIVGATQQSGPEVGAALSGGGFANTFPRPPWQDSAVTTYLSLLGDTNAGLFNASGRGVPDVSAQGINITIGFNGTIHPVSGTSASAPIFAAVIGQLNNELVASGRSVLGFLNPWLYANPEAFNDVVSGNNPSCGTDGFFAAKGWDPVTGLGTPNYAALREAAGL
ncbi:subtilisin-like protein [Roridomyces roridus]|uniref:tripeptidyl-peptidase II n=1 Tax=Roridomyces roridus TaxID=1738132 RepID=A0AAD7BPF4_9AGAR|nr:subtilisin-like protein [Roridomyces roridus]